jgi:DNA-binding NtrC family response regulator
MKLKKYVLIIDDDLNVARSLKSQIYNVFGSTFSYEIATSGEEGLDLVNEILEEIDILVTLSDWLMPGMKGDDFLIQLHKIVPDAVKIMVTGHATPDAIQRAYREANLYKVIHKPWTEEELIEAIRRNLED